MPQSIKYVITKFRKSLRIALTRTMLVRDVVKTYASVLTDAEGTQVSRRPKNSILFSVIRKQRSLMLRGPVVNHEVRLLLYSSQ